MNPELAVLRLAALAQPSRLAVFRLLVRKGPAGMPAGEIAEHLGVAPNALSFHLKELSKAGMLTSRAKGRYIYYAADFAAMNALLEYLTENCCVGSATACDTPAMCKKC